VIARASLVAAVLATVALYVVFRRLHARWPSIATMPIVGATAVLIAVMALSGADVAVYERGTRPLAWMLGPATVAMAVPLYRQRARIRARARAVFAGVAAGALTSVLSVLVAGRLLHLNRPLLVSLAPKSATNPIAIPVSERLGGLGSLTAAIVVLTGIFGMIIGPRLLSAARIRDPLARGLAMGTGAHAAGTARALSIDPVEGATSGTAMILAGLLTAILAPILVPLFLGDVP
jgi:predicted murein hydrolase (TIGR00659 family)